MSDSKEPCGNDQACGCHGDNQGNCCGGSSQWLWGVLAIFAVIVLVMSLPATNSESSAPRPTAAAARTNNPSVQGTNLPKLLYLGAGKCESCNQMLPAVQEAEASGKIIVESIPICERQDDWAKYEVKTVPTEIFYDAAGKEIFRHDGAMTKEAFVAKWKEFGVDLGQPKQGAATKP